MTAHFRSTVTRKFTRRLHLALGVVATLATMTPGAANAQSWYGALMGTNEVPPNSSTATGFVSMSRAGSMLTVSLNWSGITGGAITAGHIHCCTNPGSNIGVAVGFTGLPNTTSGSYTKTFDLGLLSTYTGAFVTNFGGGTVAGAEAALVSGLDAGRAYVNLHNAVYPGGEIRANVVVTPEPSSVLTVAFGLLALGVTARHRRRSQG